MRLPFQLDRYTLVERIGSGAFGSVYRAEVRGDMGFVSDFAVKVLDTNVLAENPDVARSMADEARILSQLDHPNIVKVIDFKHVDHEILGDVFFMVMEFVRGHDVGDILDALAVSNTWIPASAVLHMGLMISDALAHAHRLINREGQEVAIVHRDLKPQNLMVNFRGQVKILDFGIAKATDKASRLAEHTQAGQTKGTVFYMSPEQLAGEELDGRSDLYSLGTILFELLLGERLLDVEVGSAADLARAMHIAIDLDTETRLKTLRDHLATGICGDLEEEAIDGWLALLRVALQKDRRYRPDDARIFAEQMEWLRSKHPAAEDRNFWSTVVREIATDRPALDDAGGERGAVKEIAAMADEVSRELGVSTADFFGIGLEDTEDEVDTEGPMSVSNVPVTRAMSVVSGSSRTFGSPAVRQIEPPEELSLHEVEDKPKPFHQTLDTPAAADTRPPPRPRPVRGPVDGPVPGPVPRTGPGASLPRTGPGASLPATPVAKRPAARTPGGRGRDDRSKGGLLGLLLAFGALAAVVAFTGWLIFGPGDPDPVVAIAPTPTPNVATPTPAATPEPTPEATPADAEETPTPAADEAPEPTPVRATVPRHARTPRKPRPAPKPAKAEARSKPTPAALADQAGLLHLSARPRARVLVDGVDVGTTDETRKGYSVKPGSYRITFVCDDEVECADFKVVRAGKTFNVEAGSTEPFFLDFYKLNVGKRRADEPGKKPRRK